MISAYAPSTYDYSYYEFTRVSPLILFVLAILPVVLILLFINHMDKKEKEPLGLLARTFFLGALSIIPALISEISLTFVMGVAAGMGVWGVTSARIFYAFIVVALSEEAFKFIVLYLSTWKHKDFNYSYDGVVYSVTASLGFACIENIMYAFQNGFSTAVARMLTAVPMHAVMGVFMGYFYGKAKALEYRGRSKTGAIWGAFLAPVFLHGLYDYACLYLVINVWGLLALIAGLIILFVLSIRMIIKSSREDTCLYPQGPGGGWQAGPQGPGPGGYYDRAGAPNFGRQPGPDGYDGQKNYTGPVYSRPDDFEERMRRLREETAPPVREEDGEAFLRQGVRKKAGIVDDEGRPANDISQRMDGFGRSGLNLSRDADIGFGRMEEGTADPERTREFSFESSEDYERTVYYEDFSKPIVYENTACYEEPSLEGPVDESFEDGSQGILTGSKTTCPACGASIKRTVRICPLCGCKISKKSQF